MKILLLAWALFASFELWASNCVASQASCTFYGECLDQKFICGSYGYPLGYGEKYCERYLRLDEKNLTESGRSWRDATLFCLQEKLIPTLSWNDRPGRCLHLKSFAFETHPACYTNNGVVSICKLPLKDWKTITATVDTRDYSGSDTLKQMKTVLKTCAQGERDQRKLRFLQDLN